MVLNKKSGTEEVIEIIDDDSPNNATRSYSSSSRRLNRPRRNFDRTEVKIDDDSSTKTIWPTICSPTTSRRLRRNRAKLKELQAHLPLENFHGKEAKIIVDDSPTKATSSSSIRRLKRHRAELKGLQAQSPLERKRVIKMTDAVSSFSLITRALHCRSVPDVIETYRLPMTS